MKAKDLVLERDIVQARTHEARLIQKLNQSSLREMIHMMWHVKVGPTTPSNSSLKTSYVGNAQIQRTARLQ